MKLAMLWSATANLCISLTMARRSYSITRPRSRPLPKAHRTAKETAEAKPASFEGIEDPEAAKKALQTVKNLDDKKLVDAGQVETVKNEAIKAVRAEFEPIVAERDKLKGELYGEKIGGSFMRSKFIQDKI
jgi:hypothetical protein